MIGRMIKYIIFKYLLFLLKKKNFLFKIVQTEDDLGKIYNLRYKRYCLDRNFENANNFLNKKEIDKYDKNSIHFGAYIGSKLIGTCRIILGNKVDKFQMEDVIDLNQLVENFNINESVEISRLTITGNIKGLNRQLALLGLYIKVFKYVIEKNIKTCYAIIDSRLLNKIKKKYSFIPIVKLSTEIFYRKSKRVPIEIEMKLMSNILNKIESDIKDV